MKILIYFLLALQSILWPILYALARIIPAGRKRMAFERKNSFEKLCSPWRLDGLQADYCFHFSSEGELEQIRWPLEQFLNRGRRIELIFTSESVEKKVLKLATNWPNQIRYLRLWVLDSVWWGPANIHSWISAPTFLMVRYDFFPTLLREALQRRSLLLWASNKGKKNSKGELGFIRRQILSCFKLLVPALESDFEDFKKLGINTFNPIDLRTLSIQNRLSFPNENLKSYLKNLRTYAAQFQHSLIMGNLWPEDLTLLDSNFKNFFLHQNFLLVLAPHRLQPESIHTFETWLTKNALSYQILKSFNDPLKERILLVTIPGVLCESYSCFPISYVGGGLGHSVHSLLEPFVSGPFILCGPQVFRSSEYDYIIQKNPQRIAVVKNALEFYNNISSPGARGNLNAILEDEQKTAANLISWLEESQ